MEQNNMHLKSYVKLFNYTMRILIHRVIKKKIEGFREKDEARLINNCCTSLSFADFIITVQWSLSFLINIESLFVPQTGQLWNPFLRVTMTNGTLTFSANDTPGVLQKWGLKSWRVLAPKQQVGKPFCPFSSQCLTLHLWGPDRLHEWW